MNFSALLALQSSLFILLAVGFFLKRKKIVSQEGQKNLTDIILYVVLPCNILNSFLTGATADILRGCVTILLISTATQIFCVAYGRMLYARQEESHRRCLEYGTICSNAGFLGNPIAEGVFGQLGLMYASVYLIPLRIMMWSEGIASFSGEKNWASTLKKVATHPCILACVLGVPLMITGYTLPSVILTPVQSLAKCNTALSMLIIGMILESIDLKTILNKTVIHFTAQRLIVIPLAVYLCCTLLTVNETVRGVSVLLTAMPAGATTSMLAAKYDCAPEYATKLVIFSTLASIPAILIWCMIL